MQSMDLDLIAGPGQLSIPIKSDRRRSDAFGNFLAQVIRTH
jgi:hypothetical protein